MENFAEARALAQDRCPGEAGLEAFEGDLFKKTRIVMHGRAPFFIVVALHLGRRVHRPGASWPLVDHSPSALATNGGNVCAAL